MCIILVVCPFKGYVAETLICVHIDGPLRGEAEETLICMHKDVPLRGVICRDTVGTVLLHIPIELLQFYDILTSYFVGWSLPLVSKT